MPKNKINSFFTILKAIIVGSILFIVGLTFILLFLGVLLFVVFVKGLLSRVFPSQKRGKRKRKANPYPNAKDVHFEEVP